MKAQTADTEVLIVAVVLAEKALAPIYTQMQRGVGGGIGGHGLLVEFIDPRGAAWCAGGHRGLQKSCRWPRRPHRLVGSGSPRQHPW